MKAIVALFIAASLPTAALSVVTTDLTGFQFYQFCQESRPDEAGRWDGNQQPVNIYITNICPHHSDEYHQNPELYQFKTMITRLDNQPFSLLRIDTFATGTEINSSNGGHRVFMDGAIVGTDESGSRYDFSGSLWSDLAWLELDFSQNGTADHYWYVYGNFTFDVKAVAEPATALLLGGGLAFLAIARRRRRSQ